MTVAVSAKGMLLYNLMVNGARLTAKESCTKNNKAETQISAFPFLFRTSSNSFDTMTIQSGSLFSTYLTI